MSPKRKDVLAREHLESAQAAMQREDTADAVNALFYAAEAAIVWLADAHGLVTEQNHWLKAEAATKLHTKGLVADDYGSLLRSLNQARKDAWYDGDEPDFDDEDVESIARQVEALVTQAEAEKP